MVVSAFNGKSIFGLTLCVLALFSGEMTSALGGFIFQQQALTLSLGFLGLAFVMLGGIEALLEAIQQKSNNQVVAKVGVNNQSSDGIDNDNSKDALAKYKSLTNKGRK